MFGDFRNTPLMFFYKKNPIIYLFLKTQQTLSTIYRKNFRQGSLNSVTSLVGFSLIAQKR